MNYINETRTVAPCECAPLPASLADQSRKARVIADDVLCTAHRINNFLFGAANMAASKNEESVCLRDDIAHTTETLVAVMDVLGCICNMLGV